MNKHPLPSIFKQNRKAGLILYCLLLFASVYLLFKRDFEWALINFILALVFDPFDTSLSWESRPVYQKIWLVVHVSLGLMGFMLLVI